MQFISKLARLEHLEWDNGASCAQHTGTNFGKVGRLLLDLTMVTPWPRPNQRRRAPRCVRHATTAVKCSQLIWIIKKTGKTYIVDLVTLTLSLSLGKCSSKLMCRVGGPCDLALQKGTGGLKDELPGDTLCCWWSLRHWDSRAEWRLVEAIPNLSAGKSGVKRGYDWESASGQKERKLISVKLWYYFCGFQDAFMSDINSIHFHSWKTRFIVDNRF